MVVKKQRRFRRPDCVLHATEWIPERNPSSAVVMLHGFSMNRMQWKRYGPLLAEQGYLAIALDQRGHGESRSELRVDRMVEDAVSIADELKDAGFENLAFVGQSMGALVSSISSTKTEAIDCLVLVSSGIDVSFHWKTLRKKGKDTYRNLLRLFSRTSLRMIDGVPRLNDLVITRVCKNMLSAPSALQVAAAISVPVLMIHGNHDALVSVQIARKFYETLGSQDKEFALCDGDHDIEETNFEEVSELLLNWLRIRLI